ncbi:MAG: carbonic anhydrase [Methylovirgula sp.]
MCEYCLFTQTRRGFIRNATAATLAVTVAKNARAEGGIGKNAPNAIPPSEALKRLVAGNARYVASGMHCKDVASGRTARVSAQYPIASILSCSDSRVVPELAFDQGPGDLFAVRVAGNFVDEDGLASLEYGAAMLGVPLIMVLGHSNCGAVAAAIKVVKDKAQLPGHLPELIDALKPAVIAAEAEHPADLLAAAIAENVRRNVARLNSATPVLAARVNAGTLNVVGGVYDLATGKVALV